MSFVTIPNISPLQKTPVLPNIRRIVTRPSGASCSRRNSAKLSLATLLRPPSCQPSGLTRKLREIVVIPKRLNDITFATQLAADRPLHPSRRLVPGWQRNLVGLIMEQSAGSPDHTAPIHHRERKLQNNKMH